MPKPSEAEQEQFRLDEAKRIEEDAFAAEETAQVALAAELYGRDRLTAVEGGPQIILGTHENTRARATGTLDTSSLTGPSAVAQQGVFVQPPPPTPPGGDRSMLNQNVGHRMTNREIVEQMIAEGRLTGADAKLARRAVADERTANSMYWGSNKRGSLEETLRIIDPHASVDWRRTLTSILTYVYDTSGNTEQHSPGDVTDPESPAFDIADFDFRDFENTGLVL